MTFTIGTDANGNVSLYAAQSASGTTSLLATINKVNTYTSGKTSLRSLIGTWGQPSVAPTPSITQTSFSYVQSTGVINWYFSVSNTTSSSISSTNVILYSWNQSTGLFTGTFAPSATPPQVTFYLENVQSGYTTSTNVSTFYGTLGITYYYNNGINFTYSVYENNYGDISYLENNTSSNTGYIESLISSNDLNTKINNEIANICSSVESYYYESYGTPGSTYVCQVTYRDAFTFQTGNR
jgi:hypothetical protein